MGFRKRIMRALALGIGFSALAGGVWAMGPPPEGQSGPVGFLFSFGPIIILFVIMYLLIIRPQQKRQKEHKKMLEELKKGDAVVTSGGMFGEVFAFNDDRGTVVLKVGGDVKLEYLRSSITSRLTK